MHWRRKWQPTPVFLPGESQGQGSLLGCRLWDRTESDTTEATQQQQQQQTPFPTCRMSQSQFRALGRSILESGFTLQFPTVQEIWISFQNSCYTLSKNLKKSQTYLDNILYIQNLEINIFGTKGYSVLLSGHSLAVLLPLGKWLTGLGCPSEICGSLKTQMLRDQL